MPYCDQHNEVYRGEECPICAGDSGGDEAETDTGTADPAAAGDDVDDLVRRAVESATENVDVDADDAVVGAQEKSVDRTTVGEIDQSRTVVDNTETHDESTTIEDSVVNRSNVGDGDGDGSGAEADESPTVEDSVVNRSNVDGGDESSQPGSADGAAGDADAGGGETRFCTRCGVEVDASATACPSCGKRL